MDVTLLKRSVTAKQELTQSIDRLYERLRAASAPLEEKEQIFVDLREKYTGADVGLFSVFFLNLVHLKKGQAVFTKAGVPHAYLKGNVVECMANSDNVVRAGLTPKFRDIETLIDILTYETGPAGILEDGSGQAETIYQVPVAEFQLSRWQMSPGEQKKQLTHDRPQILLVTEGEILVRWGGETQRDANIFRTGQSILIPAFLKEYQIVSQHPTELFGTSVPPK
jgi:mannose-6-phosphate isomerase